MFDLCVLALATVYIAYLEYRRTKLALDLSKLQGAIGVLRADRDTLKAQVANEQAANQAAVDKAVADTTAADQAQVDAVVVDPPPAPVPVADVPA